MRYENDALGKLEIRKKFRELINLGFVDVYRLKNKDGKILRLGLFRWLLAKKLWYAHRPFFTFNNLIENIKSININKNLDQKLNLLIMQLN